MNEAAVAAATILALGTVLVALVTVVLHGRGTKLDDDQKRETSASRDYQPELK